ncbi:alpha/beta fold hydrolase [Kriegella aquimaris]|uniref:AB hydrolase-1 domain-containing protein n=1 Tax=Kriegella aquimaris TaxID=192904 RepID=A0A1G9V2B2_9FLAO|nr:alpha/beta fold hydrolase [Kriegella aquimaris]SDM66258.1 hypothetical protein SAMN04488514_11282 [Kriegella aquimaris]
MKSLTDVSSLIFFPSTDQSCPDGFKVIRDKQLEFLFQDNGSDKTIICFHGNGESAYEFWNAYKNLFEIIKSNYIIYEYRGFGTRQGNQDLINLLEDLQYFQEIDILKNQKTIVFGRSFGSLPAIELASKIQAKTMIIENGILDTVAWIKRVIVEDQMIHGGHSFINTNELTLGLNEFYNNEAKLNSFAGQILLFYNTDARFPNSAKQFNILNNRYNGEKTRYHLLKYGDHNCILDANFTEYSSIFKKVILG